MTAHSPGPWRWESGDPTIEGANGGAVCHVAEHGNVRTAIARGEDFSSADARLIAAAPELLEWLKVFHPMRCQTGVRCDACALIARIEGEP